eukprot:scaffold7716_cov102-Isochrysis_galbana.AAC.2
MCRWPPHQQNSHMHMCGCPSRQSAQLASSRPPGLSHGSQVACAEEQAGRECEPSVRVDSDGHRQGALNG